MAAKKAEVIITCDGAQAKQVLEGINRELARAIKEREQLLQKQKQNGTLTQDEIKRDRELKKYIDSLTTAQQKSAQQMKKYADVMKDLAGSKTKDLKRALGEVKRALDNMSSKDPKRAQLLADLKRIQAQIDANTGAIKKQQSAWGSLGTTMKNLFAYAGIFAGFNKLKSMVEGVFKSNLKLSDSLADIRKVSGLTMDEINRLYNNISKIDTRNTIETLNKLAYAGAKLGIGQNYGVEGLTGFVRAAEQVQMALGEDLGEDALPALAKLTEVMGLIPKYGVEQAMQKSASAIFQLGATSTATGKNIVEFSKRLMGLANVSRVSADELLAIGSASDAMGLMPEVAATAFNKLFTSIQKNHNLLEKSLGLVQGSINENFTKGQTIKTIIDIFDSMNKRGNMNALDGIFKDLGSDGARLVAVMTTMADRVDILKTHLATSTKAFKDGTAVINEYMIQNETAAALMERASNIWAKAFTNPEGVEMVKQLADEWYRLSREMTQNATVMYSFKKIIEGVALSLKTIIQLSPLLIHALAFGGLLATVRSIYFGIVALITGIKTATTAAMTFNAVIKSNVVLAAVSAIAAGIALWCEHLHAAAEEAERAERRQAELNAQLVKSKENIEMVAAPLTSYKKALDQSNKSLDERNRLLKDLLKSDYQQYLDYLGIEIDGAIDLAKAYAQVVKVLKQKKAYEEREQYRDEVNQGNKMDRMRAGMQFSQTAKTLGANGVDADWLRQRHNLSVDTIVSSIVKSAGGSVKTIDLGSGAKGNAYYDKAGKMIEAAVINRLTQNIRDYHASRTTEQRLNKEVDELYKTEVGDFDMEKFQEESLKGQLKRKGSLSNLKPDKEAEKALTKAQQEEKKRLRKEMEDAQRDSTAVINSIEEFYRLQESMAEQLAADGKLTRGEADRLVEYIRNRKDEMLLEARRAITGNENQFDKLRKEMGKDLLRPEDTASKRSMETIQTVDVQKAAQNLKKYDGGNDVYGLNSGSFTQSVLKNAAQNELNIQRRQAKVADEVDKMLKQYRFVEQAQKEFGNDLVKLGLITEGYEKVVKQLADGTEITANTKDVQALAKKITGMDSQKLFGVNPDDVNSLKSFIDDLMNTVDADGKQIRESFATMFPNLNEWMKNPEQYKEQMQAFYQTLLDYDTDYYKAIKQSYDLQKRTFEERWETSGKGQAYATLDKTINIESRKQKMTGADQGVNFGEQAGFLNINNDPQVQLSLLRMAQMQEELEMYKETNAQKKLEGEELAAFQQGLFEKQQALDEAEIAMQETLMQHINDHISKLEQWTQPVEQFGADMGAAFGKLVFEGESMADGMRSALQSMVQSWGQATIEIIKQIMMQQMKERLLGKATTKEMKKTEKEKTDTVEQGGEERLKATTLLETGAASVVQQVGQMTLSQKQTQDAAESQQEAGKAQGSVLAGIAEGAAKIIGSLGPWGAPLIAVITALLMGLLNTALAALSGGSSSGGNSATTKRKVKLAQGMLTYDSGNVQTVLGDDGRVYHARQSGSLPEGVSMVNEPIVTRVNGQQALVGERGPEIVIGRKATRQMQMNRPDLLRAIALFDRGYTGHTVRTFDEGNLEDMATAIAAASPSATVPESAEGRAAQEARNAAMMQTLGQLAFTIGQLQQQLSDGIQASINMYGENGLHNKLKQADKFLSRYGR